MTEQHMISFTSDEETNESNLMYGFPQFLSPLSSPKRDPGTFPETSPEAGLCFSSSHFDWSVDDEALATGCAEQSSESNTKDVMPLIPSSSSDAILSSPHGSSSCPWEMMKQPLMMRRNYPPLHSAQPPPAAAAKEAHHEFAAVQNSTSNTTNNDIGMPSLFPFNGTYIAPHLSTADNDTAELYDEMLQAKADHVAKQQQFSACVMADTTASNAEAVDFSSLNVGPLPPSTNMADHPSLGFFYDQQQQLQLDQKVQSKMQGGPQVGYQLKENVPHLDPKNQLHCGVVTSGAESNIGQNFLLRDHPTRLSIPSDEQFLDPVHNFLRLSCIEVFVCGSTYNSGGRGRGAKPHLAGQVGLRCTHCKDIQRSMRANQAVSYPSRTENIFESVRNYQRIHFEACEYIPSELKKKYKELVSKTYRKIHLKYIKVYFAEAACEIGMVQTPNGLFFGAPPNTSGKPSEKLQAIMSIAENPSSSEHRKMKDLLFPKVDERVENSKFSHVASIQTRNVIAICRQEKTAFVYPSDFPTLSDFRFVLYHQFVSCRPPTTALNRRKTKPEKWDTLSGLCCKHCAKAYPGARYHEGMYFPLDLESLHDSSFFNNLTCHIMTCPLVPLETKEALDELQLLAAEHGVVTKRGAKRFFLKKLWDRMANYYPAP
eukprot:scaffold3350_cov78-Skeletonema_dohrnii-CCMP3373.AAC.3